MKRMHMTVLLAAGLLATVLGATLIAQGQMVFNVKSMPPSVVQTLPQAGDTAVDPATSEIKVTFSKDMTLDSWSWSQVSNDTFPQVNGQVHYLPDKRTCVLPVKLEPGKTYVFWLNRANFQNFKDADRNPAVPYLLVFETKK